MRPWPLGVVAPRQGSGLPPRGCRSGSSGAFTENLAAVTALIAFFQDAQSAGLNVALRFFPDDEPAAGCNEVACDAGACAVPLVNAGLLNDQPAYADAQQKALVDAVMDAVKRHAAGAAQSDDVTIMAIRYGGASRGSSPSA